MPMLMPVTARSSTSDPTTAVKRRKRPVLLLTGFGPFPGAPRNASSMLIEELSRSAARSLPGFSIHAETLPTEWLAGPALLDRLLDEHDPVVALHFGVSHRARGFVVETRARNLRQDLVDACGAAPVDACIAGGGPEELAATLPTGLIVERLRRQGLPVQLSRDAGGYLCNAILYHSLATARRREQPDAPGRGRATRRGFIHIPDRLAGRHLGGTRRSSASLLDWDGAIDGGLAIMELAAAVAGRESQPVDMAGGAHSDERGRRVLADATGRT